MLGFSPLAAEPLGAVAPEAAAVVASPIISKADLDRAPIEIVEIRLPKCINQFGVGPCTAVGTGDAKCYGTRATCRVVENYRDTPDRHLTPDQIYTQGDAVVSGDLTRTASIFAAFDVRIDLNPNGVIWEQGGPSDAAFLGVTSGNLVFRAGGGGIPPAADIGVIRVDVSPYEGSTLTLYTEIIFNASATSTINLWAFDPVELTLVLIGTDDFTAGAEWSGTDPGGIGYANSATPTGESAANFTGAITTAAFYDSQVAPADMSNNFRDRLFLGKGNPDEPTDQIKIFPCLESVTAASTKLNVNGSDQDYDPLGRRATLDFSVKDSVSSGIGRDPYVSERETDPRTLSTFWRKELVRQKFGKVDALVRVYDGYAGERFETYRERSYFLNRANSSEDRIDFYARDTLSKIEFNKVQVPAQSTGQLSADIDAVVTSIAVVGDLTLEYPAAGTLRVNDELMTYTARAYADPDTTFTGITRATDGSTADDHAETDVVQICKRYTSATVTEVLFDLLIEEGGISGQLVDQLGIEAEDITYLSAYVLNALITEPTGASRLIGKLSEEASFYIWDDERSQKIRMRASRALANSDIEKAFTYEDNIIAASFKKTEKPDQRINFIDFFYNPRDYAGDLEKPSNFANVLQVLNSTTSQPDQYGGSLQLRQIYSTFISTQAQANQTGSRLSLRYADIPTEVVFYVDAKDRDTWVGDYVTISHPQVVLDSGERDVRRYLISEAKEMIAGHVFMFVAIDVTLDGSIFFITENGIGNYTPELFAEGNGFITDNSGLNPDGTKGATIS
jgi:hypothetical protein